MLSVFILAFYPEFYGISLIQPLALVSYVYLFLNTKKLIKLIRQKNIFILILILSLLSLYLLIVSQMNTVGINDVVSILYLLFLVIPISLFIVFILRSSNMLNIVEVFRVIVYACMLQSFFGIASYLFPPIQDFFIKQLSISGYSDVVTQISNFRMYGYSSSLTFATPTLLSMVVVLFYTFKSKHTWISIISIVAISFVAIINARTSLIIFMIGILSFLLFQNKKYWTRILLFMTISLLVVLPVLNGPIVLNTSNQTFVWVISGFNEIVNFISGNSVDSGYFAYITDRNVYELPKGLGLLFGTGNRIMGGANYLGVSSDVGYINDIWLGGILFSLIIYGLFVFIVLGIRNMMKYCNMKHYNFVAMFLLMSLISLNFKGFIFSYNSVANLILLVFISLVYSSSQIRWNEVEI